MAFLPPHFFSPASLSHSLSCSPIHHTMTSSFNQLKPSTKALCIFSSLILTLCASVALVVFGAIRLASDRWGDVSDMVTGKKGRGNYGIDETSVSSGSPSQSDVMSLTLSPTTNYLRSMVTYPTTASITMSPLPATTVPSNVAVIDDLHPVGTRQPSYLPSVKPSSVGTISLSPSVAIGEETFKSTSVPSEQPTLTLTPLFPVHRDPLIASQTFFNYNTTAGSQFGPSSWGDVIVLNSTSENYWSEFGLVTNQCNDEVVMQSPIDVCTAPEKQCLEYHEPRAKVRMNSFFFFSMRQCTNTGFSH
jgi:hypothetical protein